MNNSFYNQIENSTAHRPIRNLLSAQALSDYSLYKILAETALNIEDKNHYKACWTLELVCEEKIELFYNYLDGFCNVLPKYKHEGAIRSVSKICLFLINNHYKKLKAGHSPLSEKQIQQIAETCFDWLITDVKVASKAYAMKTLYYIGKDKNHPWIFPELKHILVQDFHKYSAGYKAAAKNTLIKMEKLASIL